MENCEPVKEAIAAGNCLFGTVDTWLIWVRLCVRACVCGGGVCMYVSPSGDLMLVHFLPTVHVSRN